MECKNERFHHILLFYFRKGKNAAQTAKKSRGVYSEEVLRGTTSLKFIKFRFIYIF